MSRAEHAVDVDMYLHVPYLELSLDEFEELAVARMKVRVPPGEEHGESAEGALAASFGMERSFVPSEAGDES